MAFSVVDEHDIKCLTEQLLWLNKLLKTFHNQGSDMIWHVCMYVWTFGGLNKLICKIDVTVYLHTCQCFHVWQNSPTLGCYSAIPIANEYIPYCLLLFVGLLFSGAGSWNFKARMHRNALGGQAMAKPEGELTTPEPLVDCGRGYLLPSMPSESQVSAPSVPQSQDSCFYFPNVTNSRERCGPHRGSSMRTVIWIGGWTCRVALSSWICAFQHIPF